MPKHAFFIAILFLISGQISAQTDTLKHEIGLDFQHIIDGNIGTYFIYKKLMAKPK
ncbi:MAG: hypothetical protein ACI9XO_001537 [Paraglaciecola sp.]|jgi:hypothetical protein